MRRSPRFAVILVLASAITGCGDELNIDFRRPSEPLETTLHDLIAGPLDRPSGLSVVDGRGGGIPRAVRVDQTDEWDIAFAVIDGEPVWLPRGFFESLEATAGVLPLETGFENTETLPGDRNLYEAEDPVPISEGGVYGVRSRSDPSLSLPCHIFAKIVVDEVETDPARIRLRSLWNPNCDQTRVTPEGS